MKQRHKQLRRSLIADILPLSILFIVLIAITIYAVETSDDWQGLIFFDVAVFLFFIFTYFKWIRPQLADLKTIPISAKGKITRKRRRGVSYYLKLDSLDFEFDISGKQRSFINEGVTVEVIYHPKSKVVEEIQKLDPKQNFYQGEPEDVFCDHLQRIGIDAKLAEDDWVKENIENTILRIYCNSLEIVEISRSLIRWISKTRTTFDSDYTIDYGVPDPRLGPDLPPLEIQSVHKKDLPIFGKKITDLRWRGEDLGLGILKRLNSDVSIKSPLMRCGDVTIDTYSHCWVISTKMIYVDLSKELWDCYQRIAQHLLAEWST